MRAPVVASQPSVEEVFALWSAHVQNGASARLALRRVRTPMLLLDAAACRAEFLRLRKAAPALPQPLWSRWPRLMLPKWLAGIELNAESARLRQHAVEDRLSRGTRLDEYLLQPRPRTKRALADFPLLRVSSRERVLLERVAVVPLVRHAAASPFLLAEPLYQPTRTVARLAEAYRAGLSISYRLRYLESNHLWYARPRRGGDLTKMPWRAEDVFADLEVLSP